MNCGMIDSHCGKYKHVREFKTTVCIQEFKIRVAIHTAEILYLSGVYIYTNSELLDTHRSCEVFNVIASHCGSIHVLKRLQLLCVSRSSQSV